MGVYIPNMEMPTEGKLINIYPDGCWCNAFDNDAYGSVIELPPHGRLIDADALMEKVEHDTPLSTVFEKTMRWYLQKAPTIIEAEGEDG